MSALFFFNRFVQHLLFSFKANLPVGVLGERIAEKFLEGKGYQIIFRDYRIPGGEIDLIALHGGQLCFIEVKTRRSLDFGQPEDSFDARKKRKIIRTIFTFIHRNKLHCGWRLDLVTVRIPEAGKAFIRHYQDILAD